MPQACAAKWGDTEIDRRSVSRPDRWDCVEDRTRLRVGVPDSPVRERIDKLGQVSVRAGHDADSDHSR
jgi:hypothetical protein